MTQQNPNNPTFKVGLCLAGAVSAGAYTAGVMDFLIEALSIWESKRGQAGVPDHRVEIPILGGASAGGMTAVITAAAIHTNLKPIDTPSSDLLAEHHENKLYHSWVDLTGNDMLPQLLETSDIKSGQLFSGLNSRFIDNIAKRAIHMQTPAVFPPPFFSPNLKLFTTLTSLNGLEYNVAFNSANNGDGNYYMKIHNDYACFQLSQESAVEIERRELLKDFREGWIPLNFHANIHTSLAKDAAMATGAFPLGLKSRLLKRNSGYVNALPWLRQATRSNPLSTFSYESLNVDGGMINNEPFDKINEVLRELTGQNEDARQDYKTFRSTTLMIDPFPSTKSQVFIPDQHLIKVVGTTLSAMIGQMRSRPVDLEAAVNKDHAGQFLIAPSRILKGTDGRKTKVEGELAIACGALDGFSGFISKEFRVHDYFLGRYNCKIFLRDYFTVPSEALEQNDIFKEGYKNADREKFRSHYNNRYQIIPVFEEEIHFAFPNITFSSGTNWPMLREEELDKNRDLIKNRVQAILMNITELSRFKKFLLWGGAKLLLNRTLTDAALDTIKFSLRKWQLMR